MSRNQVRIHYATHFLKLSLWYVRQLMHTEAIGFAEAANKRVNLYRNTDFYQGGNKVPARGYEDTQWDAYLLGLKQIFDQHPDPTDTVALEDEALAYLWPRVWGVHEVKDQKKKKASNSSRNDRPYECWTFDDGDDYIAIHIGNVYQPESPLSERYVDFVAMLLKLLRDTKKRRPEVVTVVCGSWMNSIKPFQDMFPQSWHDSARKSKRSSFGMGHWGQFMTRTGSFHERNGQLFRETGEFPFASLSCRAPIDEIVGHLEANFPEAVAFLTA